MAFLFGCENVHLEYPTKTIFDSLSLGVNDGDCIGVVGRNGDGKSTLLGLFEGTVEPDEGRVVRTGGVRFASLRQDDTLADAQSVGWNIMGYSGGNSFGWPAPPSGLGAGFGCRC